MAVGHRNRREVGAVIGRVLLPGLLLFACLGSAGCGEDKTPAVVGSNEVRTGPLVVVTTVEANRYLAMRIGGDRVTRLPLP